MDLSPIALDLKNEVKRIGLKLSIKSRQAKGSDETRHINNAKIPIPLSSKIYKSVSERSLREAIHNLT